LENGQWGMLQSKSTHTGCRAEELKGRHAETDSLEMQQQQHRHKAKMVHHARDGNHHRRSPIPEKHNERHSGVCAK